MTHAPEYHATRDMPQCEYTGMHRYDFDAALAIGAVRERCMDCGTKTRIRPVTGWRAVGPHCLDCPGRASPHCCRKGSL